MAAVKHTLEARLLLALDACFLLAVKPYQGEYRAQRDGSEDLHGQGNVHRFLLTTRAVPRKRAAAAVNCPASGES